MGMLKRPEMGNRVIILADCTVNPAGVQTAVGSISLRQVRPSVLAQAYRSPAASKVGCIGLNDPYSLKKGLRDPSSRFQHRQ